MSEDTVSTVCHIFFIEASLFHFCTVTSVFLGVAQCIIDPHTDVFNRRVVFICFHEADADHKTERTSLEIDGAFFNRPQQPFSEFEERKT